MFIYCVQEHFATLKTRLLAKHAAQLDASRCAAAAIAQALQAQLSAALEALSVQRYRRKKCKEQLRRCAGSGYYGIFAIACSCATGNCSRHSVLNIVNL